MQINSIQSNQTNFKSGMLLHDAKLFTSRAIDATPAMKDLFVNSKHIVDIRPTENIEPFAFESGYETLIDLANNMTYAIKCKFPSALALWQDAQHSEDAAIHDIGYYGNEDIEPMLR